MDSSFILSIYLNEPNRFEVAQRLVDEAALLASSPIAYVEVRSGLARAAFKETPPRLRRSEYSRAINVFEADWDLYHRVGISSQLIRSAGDLAETHRLRGYDALHLASSLELKSSRSDDVIVATWDRELAVAWRAEGLSLAHEVNK